MSNENENLSNYSRAYPTQSINEGPTALENALVITFILLIGYGIYKAATYSPSVVSAVQEGTNAAVSGSLGVAAIASMLK